MEYSDLASYGGKVQTPNLDMLASNDMIDGEKIRIDEIKLSPIQIII